MANGLDNKKTLTTDKGEFETSGFLSDPPKKKFSPRAQGKDSDIPTTSGEIDTTRRLFIRNDGLCGISFLPSPLDHSSPRAKDADGHQIPRPIDLEFRNNTYVGPHNPENNPKVKGWFTGMLAPGEIAEVPKRFVPEFIDHPHVGSRLVVVQDQEGEPV